jgi:RNA polymerase sigma-70 factor (ECF subfamily)
MNAVDKQLNEIQSTAQLVIAAQTGDQAAFGQLYERFQPVVLAIAMRRLRNHTDAQELAQDVFVQAMQKLGQLRQPECFAGWLRSITVRMSINRAVRRAPSVAVEPEMLEATLQTDVSPLDNALTAEREDQLRQGLGRLRDMDRETLEAFYVKGQSLIQMSDAFDAPIGTIKRRLHVARKRLAKEVEEMATV